MATARQIVALVSSLNKGDEEQFFSIALQVAAAEAKRGRIAVANELRELVNQGRDQKRIERISRSSDAVVSITKPRGELQQLLHAVTPKARLADLFLKDEAKGRIHDLVTQQRHREQLRQHGLIPVSTLLLVGPPGSGKTLTATALAGELHLPLYTVRFDNVITRFMGETASKLRLIFDQIGSMRGVYLFDEFDAIGSKRTADNDIGEMRRVLNSFLQFLEESRNTDSLVLCATNHPELLDRALFRRFDEVLRYDLPEQSVARELLANRLSAFGFKEDWWNVVGSCTNGLSHAELIGAAEDTMKEAILGGRGRATPQILKEKLTKRLLMRDDFAPTS
ncbi:MAG: ATP-binding protein [Acidobacteriaceae bacterium]